MNTKKVNGFFGHALFIVGAVKIIFMVMVLIQLLAGINSILNGGSADFGYSYLLSMLIGGSQFILAIASIVMIIVNTKNQPEVIPGYLIGLGAVAIEIFAPSFITIIALLASCGMYMKAGTYIREKNKNGRKSHDYALLNYTQIIKIVVLSLGNYTKIIANYTLRFMLHTLKEVFSLPCRFLLSR